MMKYVFGPVPSRRLGRSLGIDLVPLKTCNFNCVYCQLGRSTPVTAARAVYADEAAVLAELRQALADHAGGIDWLTFSGSGENLLHLGLGSLIRAAKTLTDLPVAVITNGSFLDRPEVRAELLPADAILPSVNAGDEATFRTINRPHPSVTFASHLAGLKALRAQYRGKLWAEVMLVAGVNDTEPALRNLAAALAQIRPDEIHLLQPTRPPAETSVRLPDAEALMRAAAILGAVAKVVSPAQGAVDLGDFASPAEAIQAIVQRHPMARQEMERVLPRWTPVQISQALTRLTAAGHIKPVQRLGSEFWVSAATRFAQE